MTPYVLILTTIWVTSPLAGQPGPPIFDLYPSKQACMDRIDALRREFPASRSTMTCVPKADAPWVH